MLALVPTRSPQPETKSTTLHAAYAPRMEWPTSSSADPLKTMTLQGPSREQDLALYLHGVLVKLKRSGVDIQVL